MAAAMLLPVSAATACTFSTDGRPYGPMAVIDSDATEMNFALGGSGVVDFSDNCVTLTTATDVIALAWRAPEVRWDEDDRTITFSSAAATPGTRSRIIRNGDKITIGGSSLAGDERGNRPQPDMAWLAEPHADCPDDIFVVHDVTP